MPPQMHNPYEHRVSDVKTSSLESPDSVESIIESLPLEIRNVVNKVIDKPGKEHLMALDAALKQGGIKSLDVLIASWKEDGTIAEKLDKLRNLIEVFFESNIYLVGKKPAEPVIDFLETEFRKNGY